MPALHDAGLPVTLFVVSDHQGTNDWGGHSGDDRKY
jgi:hypothetical protein